MLASALGGERVSADAVTALMAASRSNSTRDNYAGHVRQFMAFVAASAARLRIAGDPPGKDAASLRALISHPIIVGAYLHDLRARGLAAGSAANHLSALRAAATDIHGAPPPWDEVVQQCMAGYARVGPAPRPLRPGIDRALLERMVTFVRGSAFRYPSDAPGLCAMFSLAFAGCMRASEYLVSADQSKTLRLSDVALTARSGGPTTLDISLKKTKTNQAGPSQLVSLVEWPGSPACPVRAMSRYLAVRPPGASGSPLFSLARAPAIALTGRGFNLVLRAVLRDMRVANAAEFSAHSFRIGAATQAAAGGATAAEIMALGRWSSDAFLVYLRAPALARQASTAQSRLQRDAV